MPTSPIVIAHRGASGYLPEHTLEAKTLAYAMGADFLEQDLVLSRDGELVVIHDIHLESTTDVSEKFPDRAREDGKFYAIDFDWTELKELRVHERSDPETGLAVYPNRYPVDKGEFELHRLEDEIELIQGLNISNGKEVGIYPEIKKPQFHDMEGYDLASKVLEVLDQYGYSKKEHPCFLQCFEAEENKRIREKLGCELKLVQLMGEKPDDGSGLTEITKFADGIGPALDLLFSEDKGISNLLRDAHESGLLVHPYTLRKETIPEGMDLVEFGTQLLQKTGVDGFFTDFPDLGVQSVERYLELM